MMKTPLIRKVEYLAPVSEPIEAICETICTSPVSVGDVDNEGWNFSDVQW